MCAEGCASLLEGEVLDCTSVAVGPLASGGVPRFYREVQDSWTGRGLVRRQLSALCVVWPREQGGMGLWVINV